MQFVKAWNKSVVRDMINLLQNLWIKVTNDKIFNVFWI